LLFNLALVRKEQGELEGARKLLAELFELEPEASLRARRARELLSELDATVELAATRGES